MIEQPNPPLELPDCPSEAEDFWYIPGSRHIVRIVIRDRLAHMRNHSSGSRSRNLRLEVRDPPSLSWIIVFGSVTPSMPLHEALRSAAALFHGEWATKIHDALRRDHGRHPSFWEKYIGRPGREAQKACDEAAAKWPNQLPEREHGEECFHIRAANNRVRVVLNLGPPYGTVTTYDALSGVRLEVRSDGEDASEWITVPGTVIHHDTDGAKRRATALYHGEWKDGIRLAAATDRTRHPSFWLGFVGEAFHPGVSAEEYFAEMKRVSEAGGKFKLASVPLTADSIEQIFEVDPEFAAISQKLVEDGMVKEIAAKPAADLSPDQVNAELTGMMDRATAMDREARRAAPGPRAAAGLRDDLRCSFCGGSRDGAWKLIEAKKNDYVDGAVICNHCVEICSGILGDAHHLAEREQGEATLPAGITLTASKRTVPVYGVASETPILTVQHFLQDKDRPYRMSLALRGDTIRFFSEAERLQFAAGLSHAAHLEAKLVEVHRKTAMMLANVIDMREKMTKMLNLQESSAHSSLSTLDILGSEPEKAP